MFIFGTVPEMIQDAEEHEETCTKKGINMALRNIWRRKYWYQPGVAYSSATCESLSEEEFPPIENFREEFSKELPFISVTSTRQLLIPKHHGPCARKSNRFICNLSRELQMAAESESRGATCCEPCMQEALCHGWDHHHLRPLGPTALDIALEKEV